MGANWGQPKFWGDGSPRPSPCGNAIDDDGVAWYVQRTAAIVTWTWSVRRRLVTGRSCLRTIRPSIRRTSTVASPYDRAPTSENASSSSSSTSAFTTRKATPATLTSLSRPLYEHYIPSNAKVRPLAAVVVVLWMTSRFHILKPMGQNQAQRCFAEFARRGHRERSLSDTESCCMCGARGVS